MKEMDIQILKYKTLQGQFLQANNKIVSLEKVRLEHFPFSESNEAIRCTEPERAGT